MVIYGVALLSLCYLAGKFFGNFLGSLIGIHTDIGGVGFAMLALIVLSEVFIRKGRLEYKSQEGILFWNAMFIPIIVAMSAQQNVYTAFKGGPVALVAGVMGTFLCFLLVPCISKIGSSEHTPRSGD
jgi:malonate transporter MadL subunit